METYKQLTERHMKEIEALPIFYDNTQFKEGMESVGLTEKEIDKIYKMGDTGGYFKKTDSDLIHNTFNRQSRELKQAMKNEEFAYQAFLYEFNNHEYNHTRRIEDTLDSMGYTLKEINENEVLRKAFVRAEKKARY